MTKKQKRMLVRIIISFVLFAALMVAEHTRGIAMKESIHGYYLSSIWCLTWSSDMTLYIKR